MRAEAKWVRKAQHDLRGILNDWDPIGVFEADEDPASSSSADEYEDVRDRLISILIRGGDRFDVVATLKAEVTDCMGMDASAVTSSVVDAVWAWWASAKPVR